MGRENTGTDSPCGSAACKVVCLVSRDMEGAYVRRPKHFHGRDTKGETAMKQIIEDAIVFAVGNLGYAAAFYLALIPLLIVLYILHLAAQ